MLWASIAIVVLGFQALYVFRYYMKEWRADRKLSDKMSQLTDELAKLKRRVDDALAKNTLR